MSDFFAALPMYDWPENRTEVDAEWASIRERLIAAGIDAPARLVRRNGDMPPVPGGIRDASGEFVAPDPATLPADELDVRTLWRHPGLLFGQTCWGPIELGLVSNIRVVGQPDYSAFEGGEGALYSSAIVMRRTSRDVDDARAPADGAAAIPVHLIHGGRLAYNSPDSMSGIIALSRDLAAAGAGLDVLSEQIETGAHRASAVAVAEGRADVAAIDCRSWSMIRRFEARARDVVVVGWTGRRMGLPYIAAPRSPVTPLSF